MKKIILLIGILAAMVSCQDNFLDEIPQDFIGPENFFRDGKDAVASVNAVYNSFLGADNIRRYYRILELPTEAVFDRDRAYAPNGDSDYSLTENDGNVKYMWEKYYRIISRANFVLLHVGEMSDSKIASSLRNRILGEAYFLRSLSFFTLVRMFGGVPLRSKAIEGVNDAGPLARATDAEIYDQVISDLEQAISFLPQKSAYTGADVGRASQGAAKALLAKAYLQRASLNADNGITGARQIAQAGDFQEAADLCQEVISSSQYQLIPYQELWGFDAIDNNDEVIFAIQYSPLGAANYLWEDIALNQSDLPGGSNHTYWLPTIDFYKSFSDNDIRKSVIFYTQYEMDGETITYNMDDVANDGYWSETPAFTKYLTGKEYPNYSDEILLRYADVLLMKAEALNEANQGPSADAYSAINQVRQRAGLADLTAGLSYTQFKDSVYVERGKELVLEGQAWYDGQRYFSYFKERNEAWSEYNTGPGFGPYFKVILDNERGRLFPLHIDVLDADSTLVQNPGYSGYSLSLN